jgi:hypothetical protein
MEQENANGGGLRPLCAKTSAIRMPVTEKMSMEKAKERANAVPLSPDAPQGFVAQVLPRAEARALVPRPRSGRRGILMKEKSRNGGSPNPLKSHRSNLP